MQCLSEKRMKSLSSTQQTCWEMFCLLGNNIWLQDESAAQFWPVEGTDKPEDSVRSWLAFPRDRSGLSLRISVHYAKQSSEKPGKSHLERTSSLVG